LQFVWKLLGVDLIEIDHDRSVHQAVRRTRSLNHETLSPGLRPDRGPPEPVELHARSAPECGDGCLGAYKSMPTQRGKLADGDPFLVTMKDAPWSSWRMFSQM